MEISKLYEVYTEYNKRFFNNELPPANLVTIEYSNRMSSAAGLCYPYKRLIRISYPYAENTVGRRLRAFCCMK